MHGYKEEEKNPPLTTFIESFFEKHIELREILTMVWKSASSGVLPRCELDGTFLHQSHDCSILYLELLPAAFKFFFHNL